MKLPVEFERMDDGDKEGSVKLLCWIGLHRWGPYERLDSLGIVYRQCQRCGKMKRTGFIIQT